MMQMNGLQAGVSVPVFGARFKVVSRGMRHAVEGSKAAALGSAAATLGTPVAPAATAAGLLVTDGAAPGVMNNAVAAVLQASQLPGLAGFVQNNHVLAMLGGALGALGGGIGSWKALRQLNRMADAVEGKGAALRDPEPTEPLASSKPEPTPAEGNGEAGLLEESLDQFQAAVDKPKANDSQESSPQG